MEEANRQGELAVEEAAKKIKEKQSCTWLAISSTGSLSAALDFAKNLNFIYQPLTNKNFDKYMFALRPRFGSQPISTQHAAREIVRRSKEGRSFAIVADQIP